MRRIAIVLLVALSACKSGPSKLFTAGVTAIQSSEYALADSLFSILLLKEPDNAGAYNNRAFARIRLGLLSDAITDAERAIALADEEAKYYITAGEAYFKAQQLEQAQQAVDKAILLDPLYADAYYFLSSIRLAKGNYTDALRAVNKAIELQPGFELAQQQQVVIYIQQGKYDNALFMANKLIDGGTLAPILFRNRGFTYLKMGTYDKAKNDFEKALKIDTADAIALNNLGYTYYLLGDTLKGLTTINTALKLDENNPFAYQFKGNIFFSQQEDSACWYWQKSEQLLHQLWPAYPVQSDSTIAAQIMQHCQ